MPLPLDDLASARRRRRQRRRIGLAVVLLLVAVAATAAWFRVGTGRNAGGTTATGPQSAAAPFVDSLARAPAGSRIRVRVVNATDTRGNARRATLFLRELGYDIVEFDGDRALRNDSTVILSHTGHEAWAARLQRAMRSSSVTPSRDSSHYVDFTVLLGLDWKPPTQPLRP